MPILLDNQPLTTSRLPPAPTLSTLLDAVKSDLAGSGRLITGLRCDNEDVTIGQLERMLGRPIDELGRLELFSGRPEPFVRETLECCRELLSGSFPDLRAAAEALSVGRLSEAMGGLVECISAWGQTHEAVVNSAELMDIDLTQMQIGGRPLGDIMETLAAKLRDLRGAIESRDFVLLGDLLRYELDEALQQWEAILGALIDSLPPEGA